MPLYLQSMGSKVALSVPSVPVSSKWGEAWMSTHGRLLWARYASVPIICYWLDLRHIVIPNDVKAEECIHTAYPGIRGHGFLSTANPLCYSHVRESDWNHLILLIKFLPCLPISPNMKFKFIIVFSLSSLLYPLYLRHITLILFHKSRLKHFLFFQLVMLIFKYHLLGIVFRDCPTLNSPPLIPLHDLLFLLIT